MSAVIEQGFAAQDQIEQEEEALDPRAELLHNYLYDAAKHRVESKRRLNFPDLHTPPTDPEAYIQHQPGPSGLNSDKTPTNDVGSGPESMNVDTNDHTSPPNNNNANSNNSNNLPESLESGELFDVDFQGAPGQVITMAVRFPTRSTPNVTKKSPRKSPKKSSPKPGKYVESKSMEIRTIETGVKKSSLKPSTSSSAIKSLAKFVRRSRQRAQDIIGLDSSFRSDNASQMSK